MVGSVRRCQDRHEPDQGARETLNPAALDEAQLEELWVRPVLSILGHHYAVQVKIRFRDRGFRQPDYALYRTADEARAVTSQIYTPEQIAHALGVADAKRWGVNLDQSAPGERNPSQQIDEYLRYSERPWGILTDGRYWRLYHRDTSKHNVFYAVDLDVLLNGDVDRFRYFYAFFCQAAFTSDWLGRVLSGSEDFAQKLTDKLENEVYDALEMIAQGFLNYRRNALAADPATLREIYEQSLVLLYRLLFIFFAESREILPLYENREYTDQASLKAIKTTVAHQIDHKVDLSPDRAETYNRLRELFFAVDQGDPRLGMPAYNGKLFSDADHRFLAEKSVGDAFLVPALDRLARVDVDEGRRVKRAFVDYRDLEVRHLGSIYEKLLEYDLDIATVPLTLKKQDKKDFYSAARPGEAIIKQPGEVYLRTGSNERKVTGSYYTPDYIVRFIVEKTIDPLLSGIFARYAHLDEAGLWHVHDSSALIRDVLSLNILDPATGSGHFVVDATAFIAEKMRDLALHPADLGKEDELIYWKRQVASACIYAVDINPLAVELAKLSMWLTTLAKGKPLSFLDHHIRVGNSLVGTSLSDIDDDLAGEKRKKQQQRVAAREARTGQTNMFTEDDFAAGVGFAVAQMSAIESTIADDVGSVKRQEQLYTGLVARLSQWQQAADVWTARAFGLALTQQQWEAVRRFTVSGQTLPEVDRIVAQARQIAAQQRFFHWELAFPEIFFDAGASHPPAPASMPSSATRPMSARNASRRSSRFCSRSIRYSAARQTYSCTSTNAGWNSSGRSACLANITSGTYTNSDSAKPFREYIHASAAPEWVANFGENQPFKGAEMVYPTIAVLRRGRSLPTFRNLFIEGNVRHSDLGDALNAGAWEDSSSETTGMEEWRFQTVELTQVTLKIFEGSATLRDKVAGYYRGITTGLNEAFVIGQHTYDQLVGSSPNSRDLLKAMNRGQDLRPWYQISGDEYLVWAYQGVNIANYPAIYKHLSQFRDTLGQRWEPRNGECEWFELRPCSYYHEFDTCKIVWADISKLPRFSWNDAKTYLNNTGFFISNATFSMLALLQSRVIWYAISQIATPLRLRGGLWQYRVLPQTVERLPIPDLTAEQETGLAAIAEEITALARQRYQAHESFRHTLSADFAAGQPIVSGRRLYEWWTLPDDRALSDELKKLFKTEIPLGKRAEWRAFLADQQAGHQRLTGQIVALETRLNDIVYDAFGLTPDERRLIEDSTKYPYGEV
ncbi:MAG: N-6 DNA methylase [Chloroflexi bacterium]|nr:N-6 DNA methylase [Chloroflexota bacterium]